VALSTHTDSETCACMQRTNTLFAPGLVSKFEVPTHTWPEKLHTLKFMYEICASMDTCVDTRAQTRIALPADDHYCKRDWSHSLPQICLRQNT